MPPAMAYRAYRAPRALPFALRSRLRLRDEPVRAQTYRLPGYAVPVGSYWVIMGLLTYGVASGALRPERLAALRLVPQGTFTSSRLAEPSLPSPETDEERAPVTAPVTTTTVPEQASPGPIAQTAVQAAEPPTPVADQTVHHVAAMRPLAGFSLGGRVPGGDDDYREPSSGIFAGTIADDEPPTPRERQDGRGEAQVARRDPEKAPPPRRLAASEFVERDRWSALPQPKEFQPASRSAIALHEPKASRPLRANPDDPYPGFRDDLDERPAPPRASPGDRPSPPAERDKEPVRAPPPAAASVSSCDAVIAAANEVMDMTAARGAPDITRGAYASLLERGGYLAPCRVPESMALEVCAAVRDGRAVGITVVTHPGDARVRACVRNAVAALPFPKSPRLDVTRTRFDVRR
jgi:hypothetical protein